MDLGTMEEGAGLLIVLSRKEWEGDCALTTCSCFLKCLVLAGYVKWTLRTAEDSCGFQPRSIGHSDTPRALPRPGQSSQLSTPQKEIFSRSATNPWRCGGDW